MIKFIKAFLGMLVAFIPFILCGIAMAFLLSPILFYDFCTLENEASIKRNPFNYWPWEKMFWVKFLSI